MLEYADGGIKLKRVFIILKTLINVLIIIMELLTNVLIVI